MHCNNARCGDVDCVRRCDASRHPTPAGVELPFGVIFLIPCLIHTRYSLRCTCFRFSISYFQFPNPERATPRGAWSRMPMRRSRYATIAGAYGSTIKLASGSGSCPCSCCTVGRRSSGLIFHILCRRITAPVVALVAPGLRSIGEGDRALGAACELNGHAARGWRLLRLGGRGLRGGVVVRL